MGIFHSYVKVYQRVQKVDEVNMLPPFDDVSLAEVWKTDFSGASAHPATRVYSRSTTGQPVEFGLMQMDVGQNGRPREPQMLV